MNWVTVYDFASDRQRIDTMQKATLGPTDFGVSPKPALVGSPEWWRAIEQGQLPRIEIEGKISRVYWGSMGDSLGLGDASKIVLRIDLEQSDKRSDPRVPGPGGVGLRRR